MTVHGPIESAEDGWPAAIASANAWRGRCVDLFSRAEAEVSETLLVMAAVVPDKAGTLLQHLGGQRYKALDDAVAADGLFAKHGGALSPLLTAMRAQDDLRSFLCHGRGKVMLDRAGHWVLALRVITFRGGKADRRDVVIEERSAARIAEGLGRAAQQLGSRLVLIRREIEGGGTRE